MNGNGWKVEFIFFLVGTILAGSVGWGAAQYHVGELKGSMDALLSAMEKTTKVIQILSDRVDKLTDRVDTLSDRVSRVEGYLEAQKENR